MADATLDGERVLVADQRLANRLQDKGGFGTRSGQGLELDLHEAAFLITEGRITVDGPEGPLDAAAMLSIGADARDGFAVRHAAYHDMRARGYVALRRDDDAFDVLPRGAHPGRTPPVAHVHPISDHAPLGTQLLREWMATARRAGCELWIAVVDEDSDVTHYEAETARVEGRVAGVPNAEDVEVRVVADRAIVGAGAGRVRDAGMGGAIGDAVVLSLAEAALLVRRGATCLPNEDALEAALSRAPNGHALAELYQRLVELGCLPKTGLKFGVHYRVYTRPLGDGHAPFLVQRWGARHEGPAREVARLVRLAHSVRKQLVLATGDELVRVHWIRP